MEYDPYNINNEIECQEIYKYLRENDPCNWNSKYKMWIISRYEDITKLMRDAKTFSSNYGITLETRRPYQSDTPVKLFMEKDPPDHNRPRKIINTILNDSYLKYDTSFFENTFSKYHNQYINSKPVEVIKNIFLPYSIECLLTILEIPDQDYSQIAELSDVMFTSKSSAIQREKTKQISLLLFKNNENLGKKYLNMDIANEPVNQLDLVMAYTALIVAGFHTITNMLATTFYFIHRNPQEYKKIIDDNSLIPNFIEEALRMRIAGQYAIRTCTKKIELHDKVILPGDTVMFLTGSAATDPQHYKEIPDEFNITRDYLKHNFSFGYGAHACPGSNISRRELICALSVIVKNSALIEFISFKKKDICDLSGSLYNGIDVRFIHE